MKFLKKKENDLRRRSAPRPEAHVEPPTYRRNRTMTDRSTIPEVSERARIHQLRAMRRKVGWILLGVAGCVIVIGVGISQFSGTVKLVAAHSTSLTRAVEAELYHRLFDEYYQKHPFERFRFLTNYEQLLTDVQRVAPEVAAIKPAGTDGLGVSKYEITLRRPVASWTVEDDKRYYVDAGGVTFLQNYYDNPKVAVVDNSGAKVARGAAIASSRLLSFVGRVVSLSADQGIAITSIEIPSGSMRQLRVKGKSTPEVRMTIDRAVETQVGDMTSALRYFAKEKLSPRYIDVRVAGKAFYK